MSETVANEAIELAERCAREAWAVLLEFDRAVVPEDKRRRVEWERETQERRLEAINFAGLIIGGATTDEFLELAVGIPQSESFARALIMKSIVSAIAKRETASDVANRALRERAATRLEIRVLIELVGKRNRDENVSDLVGILQRLAGVEA